MSHRLFDLHGKTAYVTGGAGGIGLAVAAGMISAGARVVIADLADGTQAAASIGADYLPVDVSDEASSRDSLAAAARRLDAPLDIVVLNAGVGDVGPTLMESEQPLIDKLVSINQIGVLYGLKHAPGQMQDNGAIIATSSMAAHISLPGNGVYAATKRAVDSLVETAAMELGGRGIRVNSVCPGYTDTALGSGEEGQRICEAFTALGRMATVDDLVGVYLFLAADAGRYLTGQSIKVDGGWDCGPTSRLLALVTGSTVAPS